MCDNDYDNTLVSDKRSRTHIQIAAAYAKVAMRSSPENEELKAAANGPISEVKSRAFAVMTNLAFALEIMLKGKIPEDRLQPILDKNKGHNLKILYEALPKVEQEQMRTCVSDILVINDSTFYEILKDCQAGFVEWRYFFEERNAGKTYNYLLITLFLYASVYYLITSEADDSLLEPCQFKKQCYVGEWGVLRTLEELKSEYKAAEEQVLKDGGGQITDTDQEWLNSIKANIEKARSEIRRIERSYEEKNS